MPGILSVDAEYRIIFTYCLVFGSKLMLFYFICLLIKRNKKDFDDIKGIKG
ncbi:MAG: hypothetical protein PWP31_1601 [Clostridia bacterium]|nr:hypothetical protein [Clostridia bacterium]